MDGTPRLLVAVWSVHFGGVGELGSGVVVVRIDRRVWDLREHKDQCWRMGEDMLQPVLDHVLQLALLD